CRSYSENFNHLPKELLDFYLQSAPVEIKTDPSFKNQILSTQGEKLPPTTTGFEAQSKKGESVVTGHVNQASYVFLLFLVKQNIPQNHLIFMFFLLSYNPYDGPNEHPEAELPLVAGKYLYVYGEMDDDGFYEGELLDGQRGLVPSNFVEFVQDKEKPTGEGGDDLGSSNALVPYSNGTGGTLDPEDLAEDVVPYPRKINLIKQLARSVIVAWEPPVVPLGWGNITGYNVLVDGEIRASLPYGSRTKCLLEKLDIDACVYRVSVQSATDRGLSDELRCTLLVGANVVVAPYGLRVDDIQRDTAELSWLPSNSNYAHTVFLDGVEHAVVKSGRYRLRFHNLKPLTVYKVTVVAQPHQMPWQLPLEQRERKEAGVEFCTQAAGPPMPPQDVQVLCGQAQGVLQVRWKPPMLSPTGTSNGANVIGYAVCTKGQRIAEVLFPMADYVTVELSRIQCMEAREVIVRTLSLQGESQDSQVAVIPNNLLVPLPPIALPPPIDLNAKEHTVHHGGAFPPGQPGWDPTRSPSQPPVPMQGHTLEAPPQANLRSPSPQRILPQPRGTHNEDYHSESSRGSDLSDIMEEDEEELYSEMQLEEGRRRNSHNTPKVQFFALILKTQESTTCGHHDREGGRQIHHGGPHPQRRPLMVPSIDGYRDRDRRSPTYYEESEPEEPFRIFVALFDYDPLSMSPNPDAADEELPFKEGQIIRVYGDKDTDGFYRGEVRGRMGLIPCNMVSEIRADDDETMEELIKQGFLPLSTPVDRIEQNRRGLRRDQASRRMVALYDYDPRESSPNVDVEAELTFCAGDIIAVFGDIDEDGFYYGELNGHRGLVPSNFLEEVPDDVEVYLTDTPSQHPQEGSKEIVHFTP
uniref:RIMS-binding protein 2 n=1 Tax=Oryzias melastigma TaxID=30732 RepID=A0A3B3DYV2_ORYME